MQLNLFNAGISRRLASHLIDQRSALELENADLSKGVLTPLKDDSEVKDVKGGNSLYRFKGNWVVADEKRSFLEYQNWLYFSNSTTRLMKSKDGVNFKPVGIEEPKGDYKVDFVNYSTNLSKSQVTISGTDVNFKVVWPQKSVFTQGWGPNPSRQSSLSSFTRLIYFRLNSGHLIPVDIGKYFPGDDSTHGDIYVFDGYYIQWWNRTNDNHLDVAGIYHSRQSDPYRTEDFYYCSKFYGALTKPAGGGVNTYNGAQVGGNTNEGTLRDHYPNGIEDWVIKGFKEFIIETKENINSDKYTYTNVYTYPTNSTQWSSGYNKENWRMYKNWGFNFTTNTQFKTLPGFQPAEFVVKLNDSGDARILTGLKKGAPQGNQDVYNLPNLITDDKLLPAPPAGSDSTPKYRLYFTCYNKDEGLESPPLLTKDIDYDLPQNIDITDFVLDPNSTNVKVYLQGQNISEPTLIRILDLNTKIFSITSTDFVVNLSEVLNSYNNTPPVRGLSMVTEYVSLLFAYKDSTLYYSDIGQPNYWGKYNFISFDDDITGLAPTLNGLLVFTKGKTFIIVGNSHETFSKHLLDSSTGCITPNSIQSVRQNVIWQSVDGICLSNGGAIQVISRNNLGRLETPPALSSAYHDDIYYLSFSDHTLVCDMREGISFLKMTNAYNAMFRDPQTDKLYSCTPDKRVVEVCGDESKVKKIRYVSPKFASGSMSEFKVFKNFYTNVDGDLNIKIWLNDEIAYDSKCRSGIEELKVSQEKMRSYYVQFEVEGYGTLNEIEFKTQGRENGR